MRTSAASSSWIIGRSFAPGDKVRVLDGAFSSCLGLFEGMAERERIAILLDLLGRKVRVVLDADLVAAAFILRARPPFRGAFAARYLVRAM